MLFTLAETDNSLEINLVGEGEDNLEPSFVVLGLLAIFLESDDDLGLDYQLRISASKCSAAYLSRFGSGELDGSVKILPTYRQWCDDRNKSRLTANRKRRHRDIS